MNENEIKEAIIDYITSHFDEDTTSSCIVEKQGYGIGFDFSIYFEDLQENIIDGMVESSWYAYTTISVYDIDVHTKNGDLCDKIGDFIHIIKK